MSFKYIPPIGGLFHPLFNVLNFVRFFIFYQGKIFLRFTIPLLCLDHTMECRHGFIRDPLESMELGSFIALVFQDLISVLSDVIEYNCKFNTGIYEA